MSLEMVYYCRNNIDCVKFIDNRHFLSASCDKWVLIEIYFCNNND